MKIKQLLTKTGRTITKNSPLILTVTGVVGLGATALFTYKSRKRIDEIVTRIEEDNDNNIEINRFEVGRDLLGALALPITLGLLSTSAIVLSYKIQNTRILGLAGALATVTAEHEYYKNKYKKQHGEEEYTTFYTPTESTAVSTTDAKGKTKEVIEEVKKEVPSIGGEWFDKSAEYTSDNHDYNLAYVNSVKEKLELRMFQRGFLLMNEVREQFGFERTRSGALLGWSTENAISIDPTVTWVMDTDTGFRHPEIYIQWTTPKYVYDSIEFTEV